MNTVLNTGTSRPLVHKIKSDFAGDVGIYPVQSPKRQDSSRRLMHSCALIHLTVHTRDFPGLVKCLVVQNLSVHCLLTTSFINLHVRAILPELQKAL